MVQNRRTKRPLFAHVRHLSQSGADASSINVGAKIRRLRQSMKMTIGNLAEKSGMSIGHISQIERDISSPTLNALLTIAKALDVNISHFFSDTDAEKASDKYIVRSENRRYLSFASGLRECQLNTSETQNLQVLLSTFEPGMSVDDAYAHDGEECGVVMAGIFEISIDGEIYLLNEGDSFSFPSTKLHRYRNPGTAPAVVIWAMTPPSY